MTAQAVRSLMSTAVATVALGGVALAGAPAAFAAPGDNGDIKIHHGGTAQSVPPRTDVNDQRNEPKVCVFYIAAFNFDMVEQVTYTISPQPPVDNTSLTGQINLATRHYTDDIRLADGQYKVEWTWPGQLGAKKSKVFKVDCKDDNGNGGNGHTKPPHRPPHGPVGAGGGGSAELASDSSTFGVGSAIAVGVAGTAGLILVRRSRRRTDGAA